MTGVDCPCTAPNRAHELDVGASVTRDSDCPLHGPAAGQRHEAAHQEPAPGGSAGLAPAPRTNQHRSMEAH